MLSSYAEHADFQIRWADWKRKDDTNTTWMSNLEDHPNQVRQWRRRQKRRLERMARESRDVSIHGGLDIHNNNTFLKAEAFEEKKTAKGAVPITTVLRRRMEELLRERRDPLEDGGATSPGPNLRQSSMRRRSSTGSTATQVNPLSRSSRTSQLSTSTLVTAGARPTCPLPKKAKKKYSAPAEPRLWVFTFQMDRGKFMYLLQKSRPPAQMEKGGSKRTSGLHKHSK